MIDFNEKFFQQNGLNQSCILPYSGPLIEIGAKVLTIARSKSWKSINCYHCGKLGHIMKNYKIYKQRKNKGTAKANMKTRIPIMLLLNSDDDIIIQGMDWIVDRGASFHATPRLDCFTYHKLGNFGPERMGAFNHVSYSQATNLTLKYFSTPF